MTDYPPQNQGAPSNPPGGGSVRADLVGEILDQCQALRATPLDGPQKLSLDRLEGAAHNLRSILACDDNRVTAPPEESDDEVDASPLPPLKILLAEDNLLTQKLMMRMLTLRGHRVDVVDNGNQAVEAVAKTSYDLLLMDVRMPVLDGMGATKAIRLWEKENNLKRLPILALTMLNGEEDRGQIIAAGMDGIHSKPVKADAFFVEIARILRVNWRGLPPPTQPENKPGRLKKLDYLSRSVDGDVLLIQEVVNLFFSQSYEQLPKIRQAIQEGAADLLMEVAHSLKGAAGAFGPSRIHQLAYQLEVAGRSGSLEQAPTIVAELEQEIQETEKILRNALEHGDFHV